MRRSIFIISTSMAFLLAGACGGGAGDTSADGDGDASGAGGSNLPGDGDGDASGDGDTFGDGDASGVGGAQGDGDQSGSGGEVGDGDAGSGGIGGAPAGGASSTGGEESSGGGESTGGEQNATGGGPNGCECDAVSVPVCGADGNDYDAGCGTHCVPVEIACQGVCPCEGCGCRVLESTAPCSSGERQWSCIGNEFDPTAFEAEQCESVPIGSIAYCCASTVVPDDFCE